MALPVAIAMLAIAAVLVFVPTASEDADAATPITNDTKLITVAGDYILNGDVTLGERLVIETDGKVTIDLNGHTLKGNGSSSVVRLQSGDLVLKDSSAGKTGKITGGGGGGVYVSGGVFTMTGGTISGNTANDGGGGVNVNGGTFTMNGGTISGNTLRSQYGSGGGVDVYHGTFTMNGGTISGNDVVFGGGVNVYHGTFTMNGGTISGNGANGEGVGEGGGVHVHTGAEFTMNGGTISGNTAVALGGGVCVSFGTFTMTGGEISGNSDSGGVSVSNGGTFTMTGGTISGNNAGDFGCGAGVRVYEGTFTMSGGEISGNTADFGAGVEVNGEFTMSGGTISGNTASDALNGGGGVRVTGTFTMTGGTISGNGAKGEEADGGGVYVGYDGTFTMSGGTISGNTAGGDGGGVCVRNGTFEISGKPVISGNGSGGDEGVYLYTGYITLIDALQEGAEVVVDTYREVTANRSLQITTANSTAYANQSLDYFYSTNGHKIQVNSTHGYLEMTYRAVTTYTVHFNANGGSGGTMPDQTGVKNHVPTRLDVNAYTRADFVFAGWATSQNGDVVYEDEDCIINTNATEVTLYAQWEHEVTFVYGIGQDDVTENVEDGATVSKPSDPTWTGRTFGGWYTDETYGTGYDFNARVTSNITIYAKWTPVKYTITLDANGGTVNVGSIEKTFGENLDLSTVTASKDGNTLNGWNTKSDGTGTTYTGSVNEDDLYNNGAGGTLYAQWNIEYTVTFETGNGTVFQTQNVNRGSLATEPKESPTYEGHTFEGWYTADNELYDFDTPVTGDIVLTAHWKEGGSNLPVTPENPSQDKESPDGASTATTSDGNDDGVVKIMAIVAAAVAVIVVAAFLAVNLRRRRL